MLHFLANVPQRIDFLLERFLWSQWVQWGPVPKHRWRLEKDLKHHCLACDSLVVLFQPGGETTESVFKVLLFSLHLHLSNLIIINLHGETFNIT